MLDLDARAAPRAVLTLQRPARGNAFSPELKAAFGNACSALARRDDLHVVVIRGAGRHFCTGGDTTQWDAVRAQPVPERAAFMRRGAAAVTEALLALPQVTIACVHGLAVGAGVALAAACDFVLCAEDAEFRCSWLRWNLVPDMGALPLLAARLGLPAAFELCARGAALDGREAARRGLATRAVPAARLDAALAELLDELAAGGPCALRAAKALLARFRAGFGDYLDDEAARQAEQWGQDDFAEARAARRAGRAPRFQGR